MPTGSCGACGVNYSELYGKIGSQKYIWLLVKLIEDELINFVKLQELLFNMPFSVEWTNSGFMISFMNGIKLGLRRAETSWLRDRNVLKLSLVNRQDLTVYDCVVTDSIQRQCDVSAIRIFDDVMSYRPLS